MKSESPSSPCLQMGSFASKVTLSKRSTMSSFWSLSRSRNTKSPSMSIRRNFRSFFDFSGTSSAGCAALSWPTLPLMSPYPRIFCRRFERSRPVKSSSLNSCEMAACVCCAERRASRRSVRRRPRARQGAGASRRGRVEARARRPPPRGRAARAMRRGAPAGAIPHLRNQN